MVSSTLFFVVAQYLALSESLCLHHVFVVAHDMLVLLRGASEAFRTDLAAVRIVFCVNGNHVALETRSVPGAVVAVLALVNSPFFLSFANNYSHTAGQAGCADSAGWARAAGPTRRRLFRRHNRSVCLCPLSLTLFRRGLLLLCVDRQDMTTENKGVCNFEVAVPALMEFLGAVGDRVLL